MQALLSKARQQDVVALLSPCLLVFAVPLLLPGVTITTVGLLDNPGFPKYGALHIVGMILLALSIVLIGGGIAMGCTLGKRGSHRVKPVEEGEAARTYNTHAASDKDGSKLGQQYSSNTRPGVQHLPHSRPEAAPTGMTPAPHEDGTSTSRHEAVSPAVPPPVTALAVHDKSGLGQYSVSYCSFQNEVELGQYSADDCSDETEDGMSRAPVLLMTSGISAGRSADPSSSAAGWQEAQEQLPESSDVAKSAVTSLGSCWVENDDDTGGQDGRHHKRRLPRALSMDAARVRADGARDLGAEHAEDKSRCSHTASDSCDLHPASSHDSSTSASVTDIPVQGPPRWRSSAPGYAIIRLPVSSGREEALTSVTLINSSLPAGHRGQASTADTHDSSEAKASFGVEEGTSRVAAVDEPLSLHLRPGEELAREEDVPQTSLSRFLSPSSASGVGEESVTSLTEKNTSTRRLWDTNCILQCDETPADQTEAPIAFLEDEPPSNDLNLSRALADDSTTLVRPHTNPDNDPSKVVEFSGMKTKRSHKQKDCDVVSLVSFTQKDLFRSSQAATGPSKLCDTFSLEQVEISNVSPKDQSLSIISLEYASDREGCREPDSQVCVDTSSASLVDFKVVEMLTQRQSAATSESRETKTAKKKKKKKSRQKKSRKGQGKTVDLKQMSQTADGQTLALSWPLSHPNYDSVMLVHLL